MKKISHNPIKTKIQTPQATRESNSPEIALQNLKNFLDSPPNSSPSSTGNIITDVENLKLTPEQATNILNENASDEQCGIVIEVLLKLRGTNASDNIQDLLRITSNNESTNWFGASTSTPRRRDPDTDIEELYKLVQRSKVNEKNTPNERESSVKRKMPVDYVPVKELTPYERRLVLKMKTVFTNYGAAEIYNAAKPDEYSEIRSCNVYSIVRGVPIQDIESVETNSVSDLTENEKILLIRFIALEKYHFFGKDPHEIFNILNPESHIISRELVNDFSNSINVQQKIEQQSESIKNLKYIRNKAIRSISDMSPREKKLLSEICAQKELGVLKEAIYESFNKDSHQQASKRTITSLMANRYKMTHLSELINKNTNSPVKEILKYIELKPHQTITILLTNLLAAYPESGMAGNLFNLINPDRLTIDTRCIQDFKDMKGAKLIDARKRLISNKNNNFQTTTEFTSDEKVLCKKLFILEGKGLLPEDAFIVFNKINPNNRAIPEEFADEVEKELGINAQTEIDSNSSLPDIPFVHRYHEKNLLRNMLLTSNDKNQTLDLFNQIKLYDNIISKGHIKNQMRYLNYKTSINQKRELKLTEMKSTLPTTKLTKVGKRLLTRLLTLEQEGLLEEPAYLIYNKINPDNQIITKETANEILANMSRSEEVQKQLNSRSIPLDLDNFEEDSLKPDITESQIINKSQSESYDEEQVKQTKSFFRLNDNNEPSDNEPFIYHSSDEE